MPRLPASVSLRRLSPRVPLSSRIYPTVRLSSSITPAVAAAPVRKTTPLFQFPSTTPRTYSTMSDHGKVMTIETDAEFQEKVTNSQDPIVVDCFATWCGPCKAVAPKVAELSEKYPQAKFYQIDVDKLSNTAAEIGVRAMPTFFLFKGGQQQSTVVGANVGALENGIKGLVA